MRQFYIGHSLPCLLSHTAAYRRLGNVSNYEKIVVPLNADSFNTLLRYNLTSLYIRKIDPEL